MNFTNQWIELFPYLVHCGEYIIVAIFSFCCDWRNIFWTDCFVGYAFTSQSTRLALSSFLHRYIFNFIQKMRIWRLNDLCLIFHLIIRSGHTHPVYNIAAIGSTKANNLVSVSTDGRLCVWSIDKLSQPQVRFSKVFFKIKFEIRQTTTSLQQPSIRFDILLLILLKFSYL